MHRVARHTVYNIAGQALPLLVGIAALPVLTRALGDTRFGLLALMWAIIGYFSLLDLGLGRATTKFVAQALADHDVDRAGQFAALTAAGQVILGTAGGALLALLAPWILTDLLHVPADVRGEGERAFRWLAVSLPFVVLSLNLRAVLEGIQRFDVANWIRGPYGVLAFAVPAIAASLGVGLAGIVALLLALRVASCAAMGIAIRQAMPALRWRLRWAPGAARVLLGYGGWVAVSNVVGPILTYLERFVLGAVAGVSAVAYFAAPYEAISRLLLLPASLAASLFPVVSVPLVPDRHAETERLLGRSVRSLWLLLGLPVAVVIVFSGPLLRLWLGPVYAEQGSAALAILAAGMLIIGLAHVPSIFLYGQGRPDLPAIFQLVQLPLYVALVWWGVRTYGVTGAALAWTLRVFVDAVMLFAAARRVGRFRLVSLLGLAGLRAP